MICRQKSPIIEIRSQTNESEVNTKITNHSRSCSQRKSTESVGRSIEKIISEVLNTENNEIEKVVPKDKEENMDWLVESGMDESDELSIVSKSSKWKTVITIDGETDEAIEESANSGVKPKSFHKYQCPHNNCGKGFRLLKHYRDHRLANTF